MSASWTEFNESYSEYSGGTATPVGCGLRVDGRVLFPFISGVLLYVYPGRA